MSDNVVLSEAQLEILLERAAKRGAQEALAQVGLHDDDAGHDIRDLRHLLDSWRDLKGTASRTVIKWFIMMILGLLTLGTYVNFKQ